MLAPRDGRPLSVVVPLPPTYRGGTEEYAYRLVERYARTQPVHVYSTNVRWEPFSEAIETGDAHLEMLPARELLERPLLLAPGARRRLIRTVRSSRAVQLHMPFPFVEGPVMRAARDEGIPAVLTYHMDADLGAARPLPGVRQVRAAYRGLSAFPALDACDVVVSNSQGYAEASPVLSRYLAKVRVVHKGVDPARLGFVGHRRKRRFPAIPGISAFPRARKRLLFIGRLVPYKGLSVLLRAVRALVDRADDVVLFVAGR